MTEIEVKILEINRAEVEKKLLNLGAEKVREEVMEAVIYLDTNTNNDSIRIRKENGKVVMTIKRKTEGEFFMDETEMEVEDFDKARKVMELLELKESYYYKKRRITYEFNGAEIVLDKYFDNFDHIPELLEIEAPTEEKVYQTVEKLGFKKSDCQYLTFSRLVDYYEKSSTPSFLKS